MIAMDLGRKMAISCMMSKMALGIIGSPALSNSRAIYAALG
jgi:hypothetical protein